MKWLKKNWLVLLVNIAFVFIILIAAEFILYATSDKKYPLIVIPKNIASPRISGTYKRFNKEPCLQNHSADKLFPRCPVGLNYQKKPIILFGGSYAWGFRLREKQTFYYKLSNLVKRPIYNRTFCGWGIQHMLYQLRNNDFYTRVPKPEYVIFILVPEDKVKIHKYNYLFHFEDKYCIYNYLKYNERSGKLYEEKRLQNIPYSRLWNWKILPLIAKIQGKNTGKTSKFIEKHLVDCRHEIDNHWGKETKFIVFEYIKDEKTVLTSDNIQQLKQNRVDVIKTSDLTDLNILNDTKLWISKVDAHPNEKSWNLVTPLFVKKVREMYPDF